MQEQTRAPQGLGNLKKLEKLVEHSILASRWILTIFYMVLAASLAVYAVAFLKKFIHITWTVTQMEDGEVILAMLSLIDASLVASLIVMVMISGYENFVSRFDDANTELSWLGKLDSGSLKIKIASAIVAISSIHLLQVFLNVNTYANDKIMWTLLLHLTFIVSAVSLGALEWITHAKGKLSDPGGH